jgi:hypothetical protein
MRTSARPVGIAAMLAVLLLSACAVDTTGGTLAAPAQMIGQTDVGAESPDLAALFPFPARPLPLVSPGINPCTWQEPQTAGPTWPPPPPAVRPRHVAGCAAPGGTGAPDKPWKTLAEAFAGLTPGQVAYVHEGVYAQTASLTPTHAGVTSRGPAPIRVVAAPVKVGGGQVGREQVIVRREQPATGSTFNGPLIELNKAYWLLDGLRIDATTKPVAGCNQSSCDVEDPAIVVTGDHIGLSQLVITGGPAQQAVSFHNAAHAALLQSAVAHNPKGLRVGRSDWHGVQITGASHHVLLQGNQSFDHHGDSVQCNNDYTPNLDQTPQHVIIAANTYHDDVENAVDVKRCLGVSIQDNELSNYDGVATAPGGDAIVVHFGADRVLVHGNRIRNSGRGINIGPGGTGYEVGTVVIRRNRIFDACTQAGCFGAGIRVAAKRADIYHNTLDNLRGVPNNPTASDGAALRIGNPADGSTDGKYGLAVVRNNVLSQVTLAGRVKLIDPAIPNDTGVATLDSDYNLYLASTPPASPWPTEPHAVSAQSPLLAPPEFIPATGSPVIDMAEPLNDSWKQPVICPAQPGAKPDIGAQEAC